MTITDEQVLGKLLGAWQLVSWQIINGDGTIEYPLGPNPEGLLMYEPNGHMSAQLVRPDQKLFASDDFRRASGAEMTAAWPDYFGYFGTYSIDLDASVVVHHVEGGWFPNLAGHDQLRHFRFQDDRLELDAETAWDAVRISWKRA